MGGGGFDDSAVEGAKGSPYLDGDARSSTARSRCSTTGVPVLWWRSVGATHTAFVMEHTIDQLAREAGKDPVDYRRALYAKAGPARRHLAVLNLAVREGRPAARRGWYARASPCTRASAPWSPRSPR